MQWKDHIISDKDILLGKPEIKGTRISVEHIINLLAQGWDEQQILDNYPRLTKESLQAVFAYGENGGNRLERRRLSTSLSRWLSGSSTEEG